MNLVHMCVHRQIFIEYSWTNVWDYTELSLTLWSGHTVDHQTLFLRRWEVQSCLADDSQVWISILSSMELEFSKNGFSEIPGSISIFINFSNFFDVFQNTFFNHSGPQPSTKHHKILCEILRRTYYMGSLWGVVGKSYHVFYRFYGGWNLRRFSQNPINLH